MLSKINPVSSGVQYDREFIVCSLDLLSGLTEGLGSGIESLVTQSSLRDLLLQCCIDDAPDVRQSAFALLGDLARVCPIYLQPRLSEFLDVATKQLNTPKLKETIAVANNACWAIGELAVKVREEISPIVMTLISCLVPILQHAEEFNKSLMENSAITLGRLAWVCPELVSPHMEHFMQAWCIALSILTAGWPPPMAMWRAGLFFLFACARFTFLREFSVIGLAAMEERVRGVVNSTIFGDLRSIISDRQWLQIYCVQQLVVFGHCFRSGRDGDGAGIARWDASSSGGGVAEMGGECRDGAVGWLLVVFFVLFGRVFFLVMIRDDIEKEEAFRGLCAMVRTNPSGALSSLVFMCKAIASWHEIRSEDLHNEVCQVLHGYKQALNGIRRSVELDYTQMPSGMIKTDDRKVCPPSRFNLAFQQQWVTEAFVEARPTDRKGQSQLRRVQL
ncbi:hypothetical protein TEA_008280 [Camellia sinensis var. sinensis]|uniref:Transportin-1 n=1 Tax=Camellia sinensis var. sinensis TaxID=542762 RepID=A0A4S4DD94_CAMSN|nr:hypothetical protein TEA_008280 [Camellia sinensis var. sinensis]